jgi:hypothetical protein
MLIVGTVRANNAYVDDRKKARPKAKPGEGKQRRESASNKGPHTEERARAWPLEADRIATRQRDNVPRGGG